MKKYPAAHTHPLGLSRRELLQVGYASLVGLGLPALLTHQAQAAKIKQTKAKAKSILMLFLTGAPSHIDTFDMKPQAPAEVRGSFKPITSRTSGLLICEHLPKLAARSDQFAVIRSMTHPVPSHEIGTHFVLSGVNQLPPGSTHMASRNDWPCYASGLNFVRPRGDGIPGGVMLPTYLNAGYGFSGQHAGFLGPKYDPWHVKRDPNDPNFSVEDLTLPIGLSVKRLRDRHSLLQQMDQQRSALNELSAQRAFTDQQKQAVTLLTGGKLAQAFSLQREPEQMRERYGRHMFGQSALLARRLLETGVPIVQVNFGHMNHWDTHRACCSTLSKPNYLPTLDEAVSALLDDLKARGLLEETLVLMLGEFGRTPRLGKDNGGNITAADGRDHWSGNFFCLAAGGGIRGGQIIGQSDKIGAYPAIRPCTPADLGATIYTALGIDPGTEVRDRLNRPVRLNQGSVIQSLFTG